MSDDAETDGPWETSDLADDFLSGGSDSSSLASIGGDSSLDDMARTLSTFGMRLDALVTSTTSYRSAITDRLVEYADTVNRLVKNQSADMEEHRSVSQRLLTELQAGVDASDASMTALSGRIDELVGSSAGDASPELLAEIRTVLESQERLGQFLTEALDQFGDRVTERLDDAGANEQINALTGDLTALRSSEAQVDDTLRSIRSDLSGLRDSLVELASGDVVGALWDEVRSLRAVVEELRSSPRGGGLFPDRFVDADAVGSDIAKLRADLVEGLVVEADDSLAEVLASLSSGVSDIRERLADRHASDDDSEDSSPSGDSSGDIAKSVNEMRQALSRGVDARPTPELSNQLADIRRDIASVGDRLDEGLVVDLGDNDVADRVAHLRDEVTAELEAVRQILADNVDRSGVQSDEDVEVVVDLDPVVELVGELREEIRSLSVPAPVTAPAPVASAVDDADISALRDEVKSLSNLPDTVAEALNAELVALRRRIKVRSEADVLTDDQLDRIAQAVADRLA